MLQLVVVGGDQMQDCECCCLNGQVLLHEVVFLVKYILLILRWRLESL